MLTLMVQLQIFLLSSAFLCFFNFFAVFLFFSFLFFFFFFFYFFCIPICFKHSAGFYARADIVRPELSGAPVQRWVF
jgi:hypothetical protein